MMSGRFSRTIYVRNLPGDIKEYEIEDLFCKYGHIIDIELKTRPRPPCCYCFVEFGHSRDAEYAIRERDGYNFNGCPLRVQLAHGGRGRLSSDRRGGYGSGSSSRYGASRRSEFRVIVRGLPPSTSWQDLKKHMRKAGDVCFAYIARDSEGTYGMVDYTNYDDMKNATCKLDDTEFKNPWATSYIRVRRNEGSPARSRSCSRSRSRTPRKSRSKSLERPASRSMSKSRSPPPMEPRPPSRSRSRSRLRSGSPSPARSGSA